MNLRLKIFTLAVSVFFLAVPATGTARAAGCNRACLENLLTTYLDAMLAHNPSQLPLAANARFTEDSNEMKLGDGLWKTVTRKGGFRQDYIDTRKQIAGAHVELYEGSTQVLYTYVLHVAHKKIAGIETLVFRVAPDYKPQPDHLDRPLAGMNDPVPTGKKMPRAAMIRTALTYTEGLRVGSFVKANTPFAPGAYREENGNRTAGDGCISKDCPIRTQRVILHPDIKPAVAMVDEESGIVVLWMNFGDTHHYGPNKALVTFEAFKIWGGEIHVVNAFFAFLPKDTPRNWPAAD